jgi:hypothetical protein
MARLVRAVLGEDSLAPDKMSTSTSEVVLGIQVSLDADSVTYRLPEAKREKWGATVDKALQSMTLSPRDAATMAGRLGFASQHIFARLGKAMNRPLYERQHLNSRATAVGNGSGLHTALQWWSKTLREDIAQVWQLNGCERKSATILCDAASTPPVLAAAACIDGEWTFTVMDLTDEELSRFTTRGDKQITGLEMMAILLSCSTFSEQLKGRRVTIWSDNSGAECMAKKASARAGDHNGMCHDLYTWAFENNIELHLERVPTKDNLADGPSRGKFGAMIQLNATWCDPVRLLASTL